MLISIVAFFIRVTPHLLSPSSFHQFYNLFNSNSRSLNYRDLFCIATCKLRVSNALGLAVRTRLIEERKLIIQHPRAWRSGGVRNRLPRWPSALLQIEKFLYPSRMVADIRIIPTSAVSGRIVSFSPVDRQTGETKAKVREREH